MAESRRRSITRRVVVAGSAAVVPVMVAEAAETAVARMSGATSRVFQGDVPGFRSAHPGYGSPAEMPDPIHAAIAAHARAYAAYAAQLKDDPGNDEAMEPLCAAEREAGDALAATVPMTLEGAAAALAHVRSLHERDQHPLLDDYGCYMFIASTETAVRRAVEADRV
jgi:hypothetical protein